MNELASRLWLTGHAHAHRALLDYGTPVTAHFAALSAGAALEHLVKSRIARINPVLLANKGDLPTLKLLSGVSGLRGDDAVKMEQVKTVGGVDAVQRYNDLYPQHKISVFTQAFNARNASAHLGFGDLQSAHLALLDLVRSVPTLCAARLRKTPSTKLLSQRALSAMEVAQNAPSFWGDRHAEVVALAVEADARDAFVLETRRSRAVERFEARYGFILDAQTRRAVIAGAAEQRPPQHRRPMSPSVWRATPAVVLRGCCTTRTVKKNLRRKMVDTTAWGGRSSRDCSAGCVIWNCPLRNCVVPPSTSSSSSSPPGRRSMRRSGKLLTTRRTPLVWAMFCSAVYASELTI